MPFPEPLGPTSRSFVSQRLRLNYLDWGNAQAPTLILIHGGRDHARSWDQVALALREDWHVICPDLRGHGDSAWSPDGAYTIPYFICDLAQLIHQQDEAPVTIVAHSLGGAISLRYAGLYPERVRKLVAIEGVGLPSATSGMGVEKSFGTLWRDWIEERRSLATRQPRRYASVEEALARMQGENPHLTEAQARHLTIHGVARNEDGSFSWKFDDYMRPGPPVDISPAELHALWGNITCPILLCWGQDSWAENPLETGFATRFHNASVQTFDNAGHWLHHDQFDRFIAALRAFL
ncbi:MULTISPECIES: alpha/beta fold hydrolase [unclassified Sphingobium]|uniref:alpha/beta fold hydrolase n=1 Tax=unclassified Sphingobium TaxID=2611147 RepID=UPI000D15C18F|nr:MULTISPECIES: alpha/beta hydrolase [unclassified Sphingobium]MBG6120235.1 pimeloyl-ACP methyl ester carboxylesterase [Sphingobium sp. JAI105]PSO09952.1 alpha/beta hydrolase [Sphingobium sp. AEW4]TWD00109.1 pimeloyl-ACP methyl ester carboxylesterase [Sphingobium sp. AEW010]TWD19256.1 pimeloyl-ACP methyl ester carboxylesterase [Sphingobium sp. AEW013]TWD22079.1 pimeloyl-ACP methyl ester carboxylesterase [Sphingobium sp. AEW001]